MKRVYSVVLVAMYAFCAYGDGQTEPACKPKPVEQAASVDDLLGLFDSTSPSTPEDSSAFPKQVEANMLAALFPKEGVPPAPPLLRGRYIHGDSDPQAVCRYVYGKDFVVQKFEVSKYSDLIRLTFFQKYFQGKTVLLIYNAGAKIFVDKIRERKNSARVFKSLLCRKKTNLEKKLTQAKTR